MLLLPTSGPRLRPSLALMVFLTLLGLPRAARAQLTAPPTSTGTYTVSWTPSSGGQQRAYLLERTNGGSPGRLPVTGTNSRTFAKPPGTYSYQLQLCFFEPELNRELCDPPSPEVTVVVTTVPVPGTPSNLTGTPAQSTGTFTLSWSTVSGTVNRYELEERAAPGSTWTEVWEGAGPPVSRSRPDGVYSYRVRACASACGGYSNLADVTVLHVPGTPGSLGPNATVPTTYSVSWGAAAGTVARYQLEERVGAAPWQTVQNSLSRSRTFQDKEEGTYQYRVKACNASGCSTYTATKTVTVSPPINITGPITSQGVFTLSWTLPPSPGDIVRLEQRRAGTLTWFNIFEARGRSSSTLYRVCQGCEGTYEYRLRFCDFEPELENPLCDLPGRVHQVVVDHPANVTLTSALVPACTEDQWEAWQLAVNRRQGVHGRDPRNGFIGFDPEYKTIVIPFANWFPVDGNKHTLCGVINRFEVFDGMGREMDFNHFILPNDRHRFILDDVRTDAVHDCVGVDDCVEGEITPDEAFFSNPYFYRDASWPAGGHSIMIGREMCLYGPWVTEWAHGNRPEIHPNELAWWKTRELRPGSDKDVFRLATLQDDSDRFHRWASGPRTGEFRIAFEVPIAGPARTYEIRHDGPWTRQVVTSQDQAAVWDADDGTSHALVYDGQVLLNANELQPIDDDIGVRFLDVCRESGFLRGSIAVTTRTGSTFSGSEGYHIIKVERAHEPPPGLAPLAESHSEEPAELPPARRLAPRIVEGSLRRVSTADGKAGLVMDVEVAVASGPEPSARRPRVTKAAVRTGGTRDALAIGGEGPTGQPLLRDVPVPIHQPADLELELASGETLHQALPQVALAPHLVSATPAQTAPDPTGWRAAASAFGGRPDLPAPSAALLRVGRWELQLAPVYAAMRHGRVALEEGTPVVEALNEALAQGGRERLELFGTEAPIETRWSFTATDLTTGAKVPVVAGPSAQPTEARVELPAARSSDGKASVWFPSHPEGHLYEIVATARSRDAFGIEGEMQQRLWSFVVAHESAERLAQAVLDPLAAQAGVAVETLRGAAEPPMADREEPAARRRARILLGKTGHVAADRWITIDELAQLATLAGRVRTP